MIDFHTDDNLQVLDRICKDEELPDFIKQADAEVLALRSELPKEAFAMPSTRLYPVHDKASTWLSSRYFMKTAQTIPEPTLSMTSQKLKEACELFQISWPEEVADEAPRLSKAAYALSETYNDEDVLRYPVDSKDNTEIGIMKFAEEYQSLPPDWRRQAALVLHEKAGEYGLAIDNNHPVQKYASQNRCASTITDAMNVRANHVGGEYASLYRELAKKSAEENPEVIVAAIDGLDRASGISRHWDTRIQDPYLSVYKDASARPPLDVKVEEIAIEDDTEKLAEPVIALADRNIPLSRLEPMPLEWYAEILGDDLADEISDGDDINLEKLKIVLESLPRSSQLLLVNNLPFLT